MRPLVLVLAAGLCTLVASGCGSGSSETAAPLAPAPTETGATQTAPGREQAPTIEGTSIAGEPIALADYRGQAVLINVWSSWWSTCQSEAVAYADFQQENPELAYLGINVADTPDEAKSFVERYGWAWPSIQDPQRDRARLLGADYQPHFILVDANGGIVDTWEGGGDAGIWEAIAAKLP